MKKILFVMIIASICACNNLQLQQSIVPAKVDTAATVIHPTVKTKIGIMPFLTARSYQSSVTRDGINYQQWHEQPALIKRISAYNQDSVIININNRNEDLSLATFIHDTVDLKKQVVELYNQIHFKYIVVENENDNLKYFHPDVDSYINEVTAIVHALAPYGVKVSNGGFIAIRLWYYDQTKDIEFLANDLTPTQQYMYKHGAYSSIIDDTKKQLDAFAKLKGFTAFNLHNLYLSSTTELPGLYRMITYIKNLKGLPVISNEAGYFVKDPSILSGLVKLARDNSFEWLILYNGDGAAGKANKIDQPTFNQVIK